MIDGINMPKIYQKIQACQFCSYENDDELYVFTHEVLIHKKELSLLDNYRRYKEKCRCKLCGATSKGGIKNFMKHFLGHISNHQFQCHLCTMSCVKDHTLRIHACVHGSGINQQTRYRKAMVDLMLMQSDSQQKKKEKCFDVSKSTGQISMNYNDKNLCDNGLKGVSKYLTGDTNVKVLPVDKTESVIDLITLEDDDGTPALNSISVAKYPQTSSSVRENIVTSRKLTVINNGCIVKSSSYDHNNTLTLYSPPGMDKQPINNDASEVRGLPDYNQSRVKSNCQANDFNKVGEVSNSSVFEMAGCASPSLHCPPPVIYCPICPFACNDKDLVIKHMGKHLTDRFG